MNYQIVNGYTAKFYFPNPYRGATNINMLCN